jgi:hypothetical protein
MNDDIEDDDLELARAPSPIAGLGGGIIGVFHVEDDPVYREAIASRGGSGNLHSGLSGVSA